jgi:hypothetical protein
MLARLFRVKAWANLEAGAHNPEQSLVRALQLPPPSTLHPSTAAFNAMNRVNILITSVVDPDETQILIESRTQTTRSRHNQQQAASGSGHPSPLRGDGTNSSPILETYLSSLIRND